MKNQKKKLTKTAEALTCFDFFVREKRKQMNISKFDNLILLLLHSFFFVLSDGKLKESGQFIAVGKSLYIKPPFSIFLKYYY